MLGDFCNPKCNSSRSKGILDESKVIGEVAVIGGVGDVRIGVRKRCFRMGGYY